MSTKVSVNQLGDEIMNQLMEHKEMTTQVMTKAVEDSAKTVKKEIETNAPVHTGAYKNRKRSPGSYKKSWRTKKTALSSTGLEVTVYSANEYRLTHLLEKGHALRNGGRAKAFPHIAPAQERGEDQLMRDLQKGLKA